MKSAGAVGLCLLLAVAGAENSGVRAEEKREFLSGYAGSLPTEARLKAGTYFGKPGVRKLIFALESGPLTHGEVIAALKGTGITPEQLIRVRILRRDGDAWYIGFNYFNRDDMRRIHAVTEKYVPSLVSAYVQKSGEFARLSKDYPANSVSDEALAFVLIAGFSLNWDALKFTEEKGYRKPQLVTGDKWQYSFWASEIVPGRSERGYYRGSHTFPGGSYNFERDPVDFSFSSFGDPYSEPRMNFPDLFYTPAEALAPPVHKIAARVGLTHETAFGLDIQNVLGLETARIVGPLLFRLRSKSMSEEDLRGALPEADPARLSALLTLLVEIQYVEKADDGTYRLLVPVLDHADRAMVDGALSLSRDVLSKWFEENYSPIRKDLEGLTAMKHGVPFESLFTEIWHELFGLATRELVASGFLADPRGPARRYQGSLPVVWRLSLYDFQPR